MQHQMVILAGGLATRLRPLTEKVPKSLIEINGMPFLWHQLQFLKHNGITDIVLCIGYHGDKIREYFGDGSKFGVRIRYSDEKEKLLGTGGAIKNAEKLLQDEFFVMYGDSYLPIDYPAVMDDFIAKKASGCIVVYKNENKYDKSNIIIKDEHIIKYDKKAGGKDMLFIDAGVSILKKAALKDLAVGGKFDLGEIFNELISAGMLLAYETKQRFYEIGSVAGLEELGAIMKKLEGAYI